MNQRLLQSCASSTKTRSSSDTLVVSECFASIQGEGRLTGVPSFFIRLAGCNLRCSWCDTPHSSWQPEGEQQSIQNLTARARASGLQHVVITGGEPMIFEPLAALTKQLQQANLHVTIETAGTVYQELTCDLMSISPKLANSTPELDDARDPGGRWHVLHERRRLNRDVLQRLIDRHSCRQFKFVVVSPRDLEEIDAILLQVSDWCPGDIMLMPEGVEGLRACDAQWIVQECLARNWRFCCRLHIELFGNVPGT